MNKYVSPIIEIDNVEVEDIMDVSLGENETAGGTGGGGFPSVTPSNPGSGNVTFPTMPTSLNPYFNK